MNSISDPLRSPKNENVARGNENRKKKRNRKATGDLSSGKNGALAALSRLRHHYFQRVRATGVVHMTIVALG